MVSIDMSQDVVIAYLLNLLNFIAKNEFMTLIATVINRNGENLILA